MKKNWFNEHPIWTVIAALALLAVIFGPSSLNITEKQTEPQETEVIEKLTISCDGPAGESFYLFLEKDSFDITSEQISCRAEIEILERTCVQNLGSFDGDEIEMDKVRQGNLIGWAQRKDLTCTDIFCNIAPDSICNEVG